jgi:hypothetical protein
MKVAWFLLVLGVVALCIVAWWLGSAPPFSGYAEAYRDALADLDARSVTAPAEGTPEEAGAIERFKSVFADFSPDAVAAHSRASYADSLYFNDTVKIHREIAPLVHYLKESAAAVKSCRVEFYDVTRSGEDFYFRWRMEIEFKAVKSGQTMSSIGMTHIRFDPNGKVVLHQDFWDPATGIYEHLPLVGNAIRKIKARL